MNSRKIYGLLIGLLVFSIICFMGAAVALYTSNTTGIDTARVAKFAFDLNGAKASVTTQSMDIDDLFTYTYNNGTVVGTNSEDIIAPGTSGYIKVSLKNQGEVAIAPSWTITESNASNIPLQYQISTSTVPNDTKWQNAGNLTPTNGFLGLGESQEYYLHWKWNTTSNEADTILGIAGTATVSLKVDCSITQYINN